MKRIDCNPEERPEAGSANFESVRVTGAKRSPRSSLAQRSGIKVGIHHTVTAEWLITSTGSFQLQNVHLHILFNATLRLKLPGVFVYDFLFALVVPCQMVLTNLKGVCQICVPVNTADPTRSQSLALVGFISSWKCRNVFSR